MCSLSVRSHRVDLDKKKLSIEWEALCELPFSEESTIQREDADYATGVHTVDVYLTEWVQFGGLEGCPLLTYRF